jgi:hypothetical protein
LSLKIKLNYLNFERQPEIEQEKEFLFKMRIFVVEVVVVFGKFKHHLHSRRSDDEISLLSCLFSQKSLSEEHSHQNFCFFFISTAEVEINPRRVLSIL